MLSLDPILLRQVNSFMLTAVKDRQKELFVTSEAGTSACVSKAQIDKLCIDSPSNSLEERVQTLEEVNFQLLTLLSRLICDVCSKNEDIMNASAGDDCSELSGTSKNNIDSRSAFHACVPSPTRREKEVLQLLKQGCRAKEIADRLFISETTVITHKRNLKEKYKAKNTVELISKASHLEE